MTAGRPRIAFTMGDVAGIGPEVVVRACLDPQIRHLVHPVVVGHPDVLRRACKLLNADIAIRPIDQIGDCGISENEIACFNPGADEAADVPPGKADARAGRAAYEYLIAAANAALAGDVAAVVTAPLNKAALHLARLDYPGHTEILAEVCGVDNFGMMLYMPPGETVASPRGLGVVHVTLHTSIRSVPDLLTTEAILNKIHLVDGFMRTMGCDPPRTGVCALNPHAGEEGLFGDEEATVIGPAVKAALGQGNQVTGPLPADTLMQRACRGEFDSVVAMYHDQGHIALKLLGFESAVNVTLGLPIIRTSPSHGTAFDIAWQGTARLEGMTEAIRVAAKLAMK